MSNNSRLKLFATTVAASNLSQSALKSLETEVNDWLHDQDHLGAQQLIMHSQVSGVDNNAITVIICFSYQASLATEDANYGGLP